MGSLVRCIQSIKFISELAHEVIVIDDCSDVPVEEPLRRSFCNGFPARLSVVRQERNYGPIVARNTIAQLATRELILSLDDDAVLFESEGVKLAVEIMRRDKRVGAVAFAQADAMGKSWPEFMQPCPMKYPCYVAAFIGFATVLRRDIFLSLGGYRSRFHYYGEEKEYSLRLLDAGYHVVYLPDALVAHLPDPSGRSMQRYLRHVIRNDCLGAIYNEPFPMMMLSIAVRLYRYFRMKRNSQVEDPGGFAWIINGLLSSLPEVWRERRPLRWATFRRWRNIKKSWPPYYRVDEIIA